MQEENALSSDIWAVFLEYRIGHRALSEKKNVPGKARCCISIRGICAQDKFRAVMASSHREPDERRTMSRQNGFVALWATACRDYFVAVAPRDDASILIFT
jgi:hypothetical protein